VTSDEWGERWEGRSGADGRRGTTLRRGGDHQPKGVSRSREVDESGPMAGAALGAALVANTPSKLQAGRRCWPAWQIAMM